MWTLGKKPKIQNQRPKIGPDLKKTGLFQAGLKISVLPKIFPFFFFFLITKTFNNFPAYGGGGSFLLNPPKDKFNPPPTVFSSAFIFLCGAMSPKEPEK